MKNTIMLRIAKSDLNSDFYSNTDCAVARSIKRRFPNAGEVEVGGFEVGIGSTNYRFKNDSGYKAAQAYYSKNDNLKPASRRKPFTVVLEKMNKKRKSNG